MKHHRRVYHTHFRATSARAKQAPSRGSIHWIFIAAICFVTFIGTIGIANAAQNSSGPLTLAQKEQFNQHILDASRAHLRPKPATQPQVPTAQPAPARQAGITTMRQGPFPHSVFGVQDMWQGPVGTEWVLAYAGAKTQVDGTTGQGGLVLYTETISQQGSVTLHLLGTFLAPTGTTALTITGIKGNHLQLRSTTDQQLTFVLTTRQFSRAV